MVIPFLKRDGVFPPSSLSVGLCATGSAALWYGGTSSQPSLEAGWGRAESELLITDFNQIEIEKALTGKMPRFIWCCVQDLNPSFIVKLGAMPQPILAAIALMAQLHKVEPQEKGEQSAGKCVDIEHMVREHPYYRHRTTVK